MSDAPRDVVGIGNAIVDVLASSEDTFLERHGLVKGTMKLIDADRADALFEDLGQVVMRSGGSAANTMVGIASLGGQCAFVGRVRDDTVGDAFRKDIREAGVRFDTPPANSGPGTGRCFVLVTPDGERTMQTYLGACADLGPGDIDSETISGSSVTYLEGYLWDPPAAKEALVEAARIAHGANRRVALTLSDRFCVDRHRAEFLDLVDRHVDILFGNEDEILSLFEVPELDDAFRALAGRCEFTAVTRGSSGAVILDGGATHTVGADTVDRVVDTTGAGDLFAAGFLFGITHGKPPAEAARIGATAAAEIIGHIGARPERSLADLVARREPPA